MKLNSPARMNRFARFWVALIMAFIFCVNLLQVQAAPLNETIVGGPIISDTTWTAAGNPYHVTSNINIPQGITLTIQPGVIVKFDKNYKLQVDGALIARGTNSQLIVFTSNQVTPQPGDWDQIEFTAKSVTSTVGTNGAYQSGSVLQGCMIEYGGSNTSTNYSSVILNGTLMDTCTVRYSKYFGVRAKALGAVSSWVTNSTFTHNDSGIELTSSKLLNSLVTNNVEKTIYYANSFIGGNAAGVIETDSLIQNNIIADNTATIGGSSAYPASGGLEAYGGKIIGNTIRGNQTNHGYGGGLRVESNGSSNAEVTDNLIFNNQNTITDQNDIIYNAYGAGGGVAAFGGTIFQRNVVANNIMKWNQATPPSNQKILAGGGIYFQDWGVPAPATITNNTIVNNSLQGANGAGSGIFITCKYLYYACPTTIFKNNTVIGNTGLATDTAGGFETVATPEVHFNTFYGNTPYDVSVFGGNDVNGSQNYFGTNSSVNINSQIYDFYDLSQLGKFNYVPYLSIPDPNAPVSPPLNISFEQVTGGGVKLSWVALPSFTTGWGYKVYYGDQSVPPYGGVGQTVGNSPVNVGAQTSITLNAPLPKFVTITAYDNQGHESWYATTRSLSNFTNPKFYIPLVNR